MTEAPSTFTCSTKYAVVTGANKGIGFEICRQLASKGVTVVLTARDEKRGLDAVEKLKDSGISDHLIFHQLDVADPTSIDSLADFIKTKFGRLDILINNAGISGGIINLDAYRAARSAGAVEVDDPQVNWSEIVAQTYELAEECLKVNYYGAKRMIEAFVPLLQLSSSARIVNVSSSMGRLQRINYEWVKGVLSDVENLTVEGIDNILNEFLKDFKDGLSTAKGWPAVFSSYIVSKAAMNAYTRMLAKKYPNFLINCACPGFVKTDINNNTGTLTVEEGAEGLVMLALLPDGGPSGLFFFRKEVSPFE